MCQQFHFLLCVVVGACFFCGRARARVVRQDKPTRPGHSHILNQPDFSIKLPCLRGHIFLTPPLLHHPRERRLRPCCLTLAHDAPPNPLPHPTHCLALPAFLAIRCRIWLDCTWQKGLTQYSRGQGIVIVNEIGVSHGFRQA